MRPDRSTKTARIAVSSPSHRRWRKRPPALSTLAWDVVVFAIWFAMITAVILAMCALLWVAS